MKKIFKILSILMMVFVLFSCANPSSNDDWNNVVILSTEKPSGETPTDTTEETPEEPTYSITFVAEDPRYDQPLADLLNSLPDYKNLEEGTEVELPTVAYLTYISDDDYEYTLERTESTNYEGKMFYEGDITSVVIGNEDIEIKFRIPGFDQVLN